MEHCTSRDDFRLVAEAVEETTIHWNRKAHSLLARTTLYSLPQMHGVGKFREVSDLIASDSERNLEHFQIPYRCLCSNLNSSRVCRVTTRTEHDDVLFRDCNWGFEPMKGVFVGCGRMTARPEIAQVFGSSCCRRYSWNSLAFVEIP
jgi:hypothetical protein